MEEKIVENKKEGSSFSSSLSLSYLSHLSHLSLSIYLVCLRSTTPLWFTDNTGSCVRLNEQYSTGQSDPNGRHQWNGKVFGWSQNEISSSCALPALGNGHRSCDRPRLPQVEGDSRRGPHNGLCNGKVYASLQCTKAREVRRRIEVYTVKHRRFQRYTVKLHD